MIIVRLMGGLGNQMFQYAAAKSLSFEKNTSFKLDLSFLLDRSPRKDFTFRDFDLEDVFMLKVEKASEEEVSAFKKTPSRLRSVFQKLSGLPLGATFYYESSFHYNPHFFNLPKNAYVEGYFQSPHYFNTIEKDLRRDFTFKNEILSSSEEIKNAIAESESVCLNIRRTDFLANSFHGVCDMNYYLPAIEKICSMVTSPKFFIFTDDHEWTKENFRLPHPFTIVGPEHNGAKFSNKFHLMTLCRHFIIPNSSFAWWAAWLSTHTSKIIIGPEKWFNDPASTTNDLMFGNWITVKN